MAIIALSLGSDGALLIALDSALRAEGLSVNPINLVGGGTRFLGGLVWSLARDNEVELALKYGVAAGSEAVLNAGTELCKKEGVVRLVP
jgi:6-phosphofructokinase 2